MKDMQDYKLNLLDNTIGRSFKSVDGIILEPEFQVKVKNLHLKENILPVMEQILRIPQWFGDALDPKTKETLDWIPGEICRHLYRELFPPSVPDPTIALKARIAELESQIEKPKAKKRRK